MVSAVPHAPLSFADSPITSRYDDTHRNPPPRARLQQCVKFPKLSLPRIHSPYLGYRSMCADRWAKEHREGDGPQPYWNWEPSACTLQEVDASKFCQVMKGRKGLLLVGGSCVLQIGRTTPDGNFLWSSCAACDAINVVGHTATARRHQSPHMCKPPSLLPRLLIAYKTEHPEAKNWYPSTCVGTAI